MARRAKAQPKPTALMKAVYQNPHDLELRRVLTDALLEQGDPRGELLILQIARSQRPASKVTRREQALIKRHSVRFLGRLSRYLDKPRFENGFVVSATLRDTPFRPDDAPWPEWVTLHEVTLGKCDPVAFLAHAKLDALTAVQRVTAGDLQRLSSLKPRLPYTRLGLRGETSHLGVSPLETVSRLQLALPRLESLEVSYPRSSMGSTFPYFSDEEAFFSSKVFGRLKSLSVCLEGVNDLNSLLECVAGSELDKLTCAVENDDVVVRVDLHAKRVEAPTDLTDVVAPKGFELVIGGPSKHSQKMARYASRLERERPGLFTVDDDYLWATGQWDALLARGVITAEEAARRKRLDE